MDMVRRFLGMSVIAGIMLCLCLVATQGFAAVYHAIPDSSDTNCADGTCWLQSALSAAENNSEADEIRLRQGTYTAGKYNGFSYDSNEGFDLTIKGGYDSSFSVQTLDPRNTVLSGLSEGGCLTVKQHDGGSIHVEGLTVQNSDWWNLFGMTLMTQVKSHGQKADIRVFKNIIQDNVKGLSAVSNDYTNTGLSTGTITVDHNVIQDNTGGAVHLATHSNYGTAAEIKLLNNQILRNVSSSVNHGNIVDIGCTYEGSLAKKMTIQGNYVYGNENVSGGGLKLITRAGAGQGEDILVDSNTVLSNHAGQGGGVHIETEASTSPGVSGGGVVMTNNVIAKNTADNHAGGLWVKCSNTTRSGNENPRYLLNNTITENDGSDWTNADGVLLSARSDSVYHVYNNIVWGNSTQGTNPSDIFIWGAGTINAYNNDFGTFIQDGTVYSGQNINQSPAFMNAASEDYHLQSLSPCIDKGQNAAPMMPSADMEDDPRVADGQGDASAVVDMGADEYFMEPRPVIQANGVGDYITASQKTLVPITIALDSRGRQGTNGDWWVVSNGPNGWSYYDVMGGSWSFLPGLSLTYQGGLFNFGSLEILKTSGLAVGTHTFYFGVDMNMNGILDMNATYYDTVSVEIIGP